MESALVLEPPYTFGTCFTDGGWTISKSRNHRVVSFSLPNLKAVLLLQSKEIHPTLSPRRESAFAPEPPYAFGKCHMDHLKKLQPLRPIIFFADS